MRSSEPPFWYVSTSNMPSQSSGASTGYSTVRVLASESTSNAALRSRLNDVQRNQSGR
jgi:hypothetical protein